VNKAKKRAMKKINLKRWANKLKKNISIHAYISKIEKYTLKAFQAFPF
jgi:hypothetical protein